MRRSQVLSDARGCGGADVEVLAPENLRKEIADIAAVMDKLYRKK